MNILLSLFVIIALAFAQTADVVLNKTDFFDRKEYELCIISLGDFNILVGQSRISF